MTTTITLPITVAGETREIEFRTMQMPGWFKALSAPVFACRIGQGTKVHRTGITAWRFDTYSAAIAFGSDVRNIVQVDGQFWGIQMTATVRNRHVVVSDWADKYEGTRTATQQTYYGSI